MTIIFSTKCIWSTWRRIAWDSGSFFRGDHLRVFVAIEEGISTVSPWTAAYRVMINHFAFSIGSTGVGARISTALLNTCLILSTIRAEQTLRATVWRSTEVSRKAGANWLRPLSATLTVRSTWIRATGVSWLFYDRLNRNLRTLVEWVPSESTITNAGGYVVGYLAPGINITGARARIYAFEIRTYSVSRTIRIGDALRVAKRVGISKIFSDTFAGGSMVIFLTISICATRIWKQGLTGPSVGLITSGFLLHCWKGSPMKPAGHLQTARWFLIEYSAIRPQAPAAQGLTQCWFEHALFRSHSSFTMHSGRQLGGEPI